MKPIDRRPRDYQPAADPLEARIVMSHSPHGPRPLVAPVVERLHVGLFGSLGSQPSRPNTPVAPFAASANPTFLDPSVSILDGGNIALGTRDYVAPYARLDARGGLIEVGSGTTVQDHATLLANPNGGGDGIILGDNVYVGPGATVVGPSLIGSPGGAPTSIGANAVVDNDVIGGGSEVGALARIAPGIVIPSGVRVLPGASIATEADVFNPAKVVRLVSDPTLVTALADSASLANGYTQLYQGQSAAGANVGTTAATVFNGDLATVEGISPEPSSTVVTFAPATNGSPRFFSPINGRILTGTNPFVNSRVIGQITVSQQPAVFQGTLGKNDSIRSDEDQAFTIGGATHFGAGVTVHAFRGARIAIGDNVSVGGGAVLQGTTGSLAIGNGVSIGSGTVVDGSSVGYGSTIGAGAYVAGSTLPPNSVVPDGEILVGNRVVGTVGY